MNETGATAFLCGKTLLSIQCVRFNVKAAGLCKVCKIWTEGGCMVGHLKCGAEDLCHQFHVWIQCGGSNRLIRIKSAVCVYGFVTTFSTSFSFKSCYGQLLSGNMRPFPSESPWTWTVCSPQSLSWCSWRRRGAGAQEWNNFNSSLHSILQIRPTKTHTTRSQTSTPNNMQSSRREESELLFLLWLEVVWPHTLLFRPRYWLFLWQQSTATASIEIT